MDINKGYTITQSVLFDNNRGFALAGNPGAVSLFVTWQFTQEEGKRDYYWGHYHGDEKNRVFNYERQYDVKRVETQGPDFYKYYSTQRPVDVGTFPAPKENLPVGILNYGERRSVEEGAFLAWGELLYMHPLTEQERQDYELRAAPDNPDMRRKMQEQAQVVGQWEDAKRIPDVKRLTWFYSDFGSYVPKEFVTPERLAECVRGIETQRSARAHREAKQPIADQLKTAERLAGEHRGQSTQKKAAPDKGDR